MTTFIKKLLHDPRFYADLALCMVMTLVIAMAAGKSIPQLGREAWATVTSITGEGTQSALAQFAGTNTIGNATVIGAGSVTDHGGGSPTDADLGVHFACFLVGVYMNPASGTGNDFNGCNIAGSANGNWTINAETRGGGADFITCSATCIN